MLPVCEFVVKIPIGQGEQDADVAPLILEYDPALQGEHCVAPASEYDPGAQAAQADREVNPVAVEKDPAGHGWQTQKDPKPGLSTASFQYPGIQEQQLALTYCPVTEFEFPHNALPGGQEEPPV